MNELDKIFAWQAVFAIGKGIAYLLFISAMIKYLWS